MRWHALILLILSNTIFAADFDFPENLSVQDIPAIVDSFNVGFLTRTPLSLLGQEEYNTQASLRANTIDTSIVSKLGDQSKADEIQIQEFSFSKKLPMDIELGAHGSLSMFDRDINSFGGYVRWGLYMLPWGSFSFIGHGSSGNYKNVLGTNLYGGSINFDAHVWSLYVSVGTGVLRTTNTLDSILFGTTGQPAVTYSKMYSHQSLKISYLWDQVSITAQGDLLKEFFSSFSIGYLF